VVVPGDHRQLIFTVCVLSVSHEETVANTDTNVILPLGDLRLFNSIAFVHVTNAGSTAASPRVDESESAVVRDTCQYFVVLLQERPPDVRRRGPVPSLKNLTSLIFISNASRAVVIDLSLATTSPAISEAISSAPTNNVLQPLANLVTKFRDNSSAPYVVDNALLDGRTTAVLSDGPTRLRDLVSWSPSCETFEDLTE
jgi:hypothetical protein